MANSKQKLEQRRAILDENKAVRDGTQQVTKMDWGYAALRIPTADMQAIKLLYPDLVSLDKETRHNAWVQFSKSAFAEPYRLVRAPSQVRKSDPRIIIKT